MFWQKSYADRKTLDLLISNYVYEKEGAKRKRVMRYGEIAAGRPLFRMG